MTRLAGGARALGCVAVLLASSSALGEDPKGSDGTLSHEGAVSRSTFGANVRVNDQTGGRQNEVSMASDRMGNLYAGWNEQATGSCAFSRSADGGATWSPSYIHKPSQNPLAGDPVVIADRAGNLYRLCMGYGGPGWQVDLSTSPDGGMTWGPWILLPAGDKPWMAAHDGKSAVIYMIGSGLPTLVTSKDNGATWSAPVHILDGMGACLASDASGTLHAFVGVSSVTYRRSTDWGITWGNTTTLGSGGGTKSSPRSGLHTNCAVDPTGDHVYAVWNDHVSDGNDDVILASSSDGGLSWSSPRILNKGGKREILPSVAVDAGGTVHVAWISNRDGVGSAYHSKSVDRGGSWSTETRVSDENPGQPWDSFMGDYTQIVADPQGRVGYAFCDARDGSTDIWFSPILGGGGGQTLARIEVLPPTATITADATKTYQAIGYDQSGAPVPITPAWSATGGSVGQSGVYQPGPAGQHTVSARVGNVEGRTLVTVVPGALASIAVAPASASLSVDDTISFTASGNDAKGNAVPVSPVWSATGGVVDGAGAYTPSSVGTFEVKASEGGVHGTAEVTVTGGRPVSLRIEPVEATVRADYSVRFRAFGTDAKGNEDEISAAWSVSGAGGGAIGPGGHYAPDKTGEHIIRAEAAGMFAEAIATVVPGRVKAAAITPSEASLDLGEEIRFEVSAVDSRGNAITGVSVTWSVTAGVGDVSSDGHFTARSSGRGQVTARVEDGEAEASASASVTVREDWSSLAPALALAVIAVSALGAIAFVLKRRRRGPGSQPRWPEESGGAW
jgi:hypothetical protein